MTNSLGTAYAFFYCKETIEKVINELYCIRAEVHTPQNLELIVTDNLNTISTDEELSNIIEDSKNYGINYGLKATYPHETNKKTADELAAILNQAYQSPLFKSNEEFNGAIVYKENNSYIFRE